MILKKLSHLSRTKKIVGLSAIVATLIVSACVLQENLQAQVVQETTRHIQHSIGRDIHKQKHRVQAVKFYSYVRKF